MCTMWLHLYWQLIYSSNNADQFLDNNKTFNISVILITFKTNITICVLYSGLESLEGSISSVCLGTIMSHNPWCLSYDESVFCGKAYSVCSCLGKKLQTMWICSEMLSSDSWAVHLVDVSSCVEKFTHWHADVWDPPTSPVHKIFWHFSQAYSIWNKTSKNFYTVL